MPPVADSSNLSGEIDQLLELYLELLHQYTTLRSHLSTAQASLHQHIARANFSAERGIRYGPDFYDARMQATRVCTITVPSLDGDTSTAAATQQDRRVEVEQTLDVERDTAATLTTEGGSLRDSTTATDDGQYSRKEETRADTASFTISTVAKKAQATAAGGKDSEKTKTTPKDPLRMFGLLIPPSLRLAQTESVKSVVDMIPGLVSVDAQMRAVEIQIRRARKRMAKAEALGIINAANAGEKGPERAEKRQQVAI